MNNRSAVRPSGVHAIQRERVYRYECNTPSGGKFWEVMVIRSNQIETRWGRLGSHGQAKKKQVNDAVGDTFVYSFGPNAATPFDPHPTQFPTPSDKKQVKAHPNRNGSKDVIQASYSIDLT